MSNKYENSSDEDSSDEGIPRFCVTKYTSLDMFQGIKIVIVSGVLDVLFHLFCCIIAFIYWNIGRKIKPGFENLPFPDEIEVNDGFGYRKVKDLNQR